MRHRIDDRDRRLLSMIVGRKTNFARLAADQRDIGITEGAHYLLQGFQPIYNLSAVAESSWHNRACRSVVTIRAHPSGRLR